MSLPTTWQERAGRFRGHSKLWLSPQEPARESATTAELSLVAGGRALALAYDWSEGGQAQDGLLIVNVDPQRGETEAAWVDSWHMGDRVMSCRGAFPADPAAPEAGVLSATGSYEAPPGPDWGWRIELHPGPEDGFRLEMYNLTPAGEEALAVSARYEPA